MIFLKRIETYGFKSFAEHTILNFEYGMTGIVGPNGSGKSNINDAIRWTLGEQSLKSLRGDNMEDIVFSGSVDKKSLNIAEVTLIFDNSKKVFESLAFDEVSITRKYNKIDNESEYFINGARVRLKDIQEVALETGLTKSSLAIISQGSVNSFVESKPEDRRKLFDEAAGVAKYKKRKEESIRKLAKSKENLDRLNDIINEIERKLPNLKKQASKAKIFKEKSNELKAIEVSFLVNDIELYKNRLNELANEKNILTTEINDLNKKIQSEAVEYSTISSSNFSHDKQLNKLNIQFTETVEKIAQLKVDKMTFESQKGKEFVSEKEHRIEELNILASEIMIKIENEDTKLNDILNDEINTKEQLGSCSATRQECNKTLDSIRKSLAKTENELELIISRKYSKDSLFEGVKNILENKETISGVLGTIQDMINVKEKYSLAISSILQQGALQNIVMTSVAKTKDAIEFLKSNKAGYATFLPLDGLKPNYMDNEKRFIAQNVKGFIGYANELVKIEKKYQIVLDYLLANVLVVENYDSAVEMSKVLKYKFHIVTLDGERILPQGAIVGGSKRKVNNLQAFNDQNKIDELEKLKTSLEKNELINNEKVIKLSEEIDLYREQNSQNHAAIGAAKNSISNLKKDLNLIKDEYRILTGKDIDGEDQEISSIDDELKKIINNISKLEIKKDDIQKETNVIRVIRDKIIERQNDLTQTTDEKRKSFSILKERESQLKTDIMLLQEKKMNAASRLAQTYNLTVEAALELEHKKIDDEEAIREYINTLRSEINSLGNVNVESIYEYEEENNRYTTFVSQTSDVEEAIKNLSEAIKNMDSQMIKQFKKIIQEVNLALPETFATLFGGGSASIVYTNPDDILNSGIDIKINPPGKKITNLNLLSGGEKSMVALSVLFSVLKVRPIPLVVLDEVEAPLDIANVERFAKYIRKFTENSQFMIVTHRLGTMENCDVLYGATMEQKGITKIVQIKLIDAKKITSAN